MIPNEQITIVLHVSLLDFGEYKKIRRYEASRIREKNNKKIPSLIWRPCRTETFKKKPVNGGRPARFINKSDKLGAFWSKIGPNEIQYRIK